MSSGFGSISFPCSRPHLPILLLMISNTIHTKSLMLVQLEPDTAPLFPNPLNKLQHYSGRDTISGLLTQTHQRTFKPPINGSDPTTTQPLLRSSPRNTHPSPIPKSKSDLREDRMESFEMKETKNYAGRLLHSIEWINLGAHRTAKAEESWITKHQSGSRRIQRAKAQLPPRIQELGHYPV